MFETKKLKTFEEKVDNDIIIIDNSQQSNNTSSGLIDLLKKILVTIVVVFLICTFVLGINVTHNINMAPSIRDGDLVITYKLNKNIYSDLVVAYKNNDKIKYGRIIGVPGDVINIDDTGNFTINNNIPSEKVFYRTYPSEIGNIQYPYKVPKDHYFILNDYRDNTQDSREFGAVHKKDIKGQMLLQFRRRGF